jgi:FixJ family two-component response regulator
LTKSAAIYVIDDDPGFRRGLERLLKAHGLEVRSFASAEEFEARAGLLRPACIILDINLGGMSGIELRYRLGEPDVGVPVIFVTASDSDSVCKAAIDAGCAAFLRKPVPAKALMDAINETLAQ